MAKQLKNCNTIALMLFFRSLFYEEKKSFTILNTNEFVIRMIKLLCAAVHIKHTQKFHYMKRSQTKDKTDHNYEHHLNRLFCFEKIKS